MEIHRFTVNPLTENTYIACGPEGRCVLVDPGWLTWEEGERVHSFIRNGRLRPEAILLTHGHMDHIYGAADAQRRYGIPVHMSEADVPVMTYFDRVAKFGLPTADHSFTITPACDGDTVEAAGMKFRAIATPGHSPGSICWLEEAEGEMFTGDTLFAGTIGRSDLYLGDYDEEIRSIMEKLAVLDGGIRIYPGHGLDSTIGTERTTNPFLEPFNEREEIPELQDEK